MKPIIRGGLLVFVGIVLLLFIWCVVSQNPNTPTVSDKINAILAALAFYGLIIALFQTSIHSWLAQPELNLKYNHRPPDCYVGVLTPEEKTEVLENRKSALLSSINESERRVGLTMNRQEQQKEKENQDRWNKRYISLCWGENPYQCTHYFFRLRVKNSGNSKAEQVEVFAESLETIDNEGKVHIVDKFAPINLNWTHTTNVTQSSLAQGTERMCEIGYMLEPGEIQSHIRSYLELGEFEPAFCFSVGDQTGFPNYIIAPGKYLLHVTVAAANAKPKKQTLEIIINGTFSQNIEEMLSNDVIIRLLP